MPQTSGARQRPRHSSELPLGSFVDADYPDELGEIDVRNFGARARRPSLWRSLSWQAKVGIGAACCLAVLFGCAAMVSLA